MKEKILTAIKTKFPGVNLSKKRLDAIAAKIELKVIDDETKIDAALDAYNDYNPLAETAKADDAYRNMEAKLKADKKEPETPAEKAAREAAELKNAVDDDKDTPSYIKKMMEKFESISSELAAIKGEKAATTIKSKATELLKDVPVSYWGKRAIPDKEEGLEAFVTEVTADYTQFKQELTDQGLSVLSTPKAGVNGNGTVAKASKEEVAAVVDNIM